MKRLQKLLQKMALQFNHMLLAAPIQIVYLVRMLALTKKPDVIQIFIFILCGSLFICYVFVSNSFEGFGSTESAQQTKDYKPSEEPIKENSSLVQYALEIINGDRRKFNAAPVALSSNIATQAHAEDLFKSRYLEPSHWTTDGMKPYMKYSMYNGTGYVEQNVAIVGFDNLTSEKCKEKTFECQAIDPRSEIKKIGWNMVYNDTVCCNDSHRKNILDKLHTNVSIGIAYDNFYLALIQNFENDYIQFDIPLTQDNRHFQILGKVKTGNYEIESIGVYYDNSPTAMVYEQNKYNDEYKLGTFSASVVKPAPPFSEYKEPSNYTIIEAEKWSQKNGLLDIRFDISPMMKTTGVYTIVTYLKGENNNSFPVTAYSTFINGKNTHVLKN